MKCVCVGLSPAKESIYVDINKWQKYFDVVSFHIKLVGMGGVKTPLL
jgi:hypothetical protein